MFIKLRNARTLIECKEDNSFTEFWINATSIQVMLRPKVCDPWEPYTSLHLKDGERLKVQETPQQIIEKIKLTQIKLTQHG